MYTPCHLILSYFFEIAAARCAGAPIRLTYKKHAGTTAPAKTGIQTDKQISNFDRLWSVIRWLHGINVAACFSITSLAVLFFIYEPLIGIFCEIHTIIVCLKTVSYALTNQSLRYTYLNPLCGQGDTVPTIYGQSLYPRNITLSNLTYFWWAPTLVYQPVYPRTQKTRWSFVAKRVVEVLVVGVFIWVVSQKHALPVLRDSMETMASFDFSLVLERMVKLSAIGFVVWLAGFFAVFHSFLNALAEVMRFADRDFYGDWWNSPNLGVFWRTWNKPVHQYMKRHVYSPLIRRRWNSRSASMIVFMLSGLLHELAIGIPVHSVTGMSTYCLSAIDNL